MAQQLAGADGIDGPKAAWGPSSDGTPQQAAAPAPAQVSGAEAVQVMLTVLTCICWTHFRVQIWAGRQRRRRLQEQ